MRRPTNEVYHFRQSRDSKLMKTQLGGTSWECHLPTENSLGNDVSALRAKAKTLACEVESILKASFHSGKLSVDWNGQEHFSLC
jgi:hypothetical protein